MTTAAQPPQQAGFTPVTGSSVGAVQMSNPVTITSITTAAPISVSSGAQYSINGGPFTSVAGTVQPGDQVVVEINAPTSYDSTATVALTIGATTSSFAVTTGAEPVLQGTFYQRFRCFYLEYADLQSHHCYGNNCARGNQHCRWAVQHQWRRVYFGCQHRAIWRSGQRANERAVHLWRDDNFDAHGRWRQHDASQ